MVLEKFYAGEEITISDISYISLIGTNFRLLIFKDFVVIGFTDKSANKNNVQKKLMNPGSTF